MNDASNFCLVLAFFAAFEMTSHVKQWPMLVLNFYVFRWFLRFIWNIMLIPSKILQCLTIVKRFYLVIDDCLYDRKAFCKVKKCFYLPFMNDGKFINYKPKSVCEVLMKPYRNRKNSFPIAKSTYR